jgi:DNA polymerase III subunit delta'
LAGANASAFFMLLKDVIGLHETKNHLVEMVQANRLSHAILMVGKEGSGALSLAMAFASYIVCMPDPNRKPSTVEPKPVSLFDAPDLFGTSPNSSTSVDGGPSTVDQNIPQPDDIAEMPAYIKAAQLVHPDIHFSFPAINDAKRKKEAISNDWITEWREFMKQMPYGNAFDWLQFIGAENKQGNISKLECDHILHKLSLKSFESPWKILIMWMPEYLGNMGNRLLKLIEEPPPNTLFLLVTENEEAILPTILSRCQLIRVGLPANEDIENALVEKNGVDRDRARQISMVAEGNYHEALQMLQHNDADWQSLLRQWLNAAIKGTPKMQQDWIAEMNELGREKQKQFLKYFVNLLEQSIRVRVLGPERLSLPETEMDFAQRLNKIAGINQQEALVKELEQASYYIERNANAKMLFQALTLKLRSIVLEKTILLQH